MFTQKMGHDGFIWFFAVVECDTDPEKLGRMKVRVLGDHTQDLDEIPMEDLPWAHPVMPINSASTSGIGDSPTGIVRGAWVFGFYRDGADKQQPIILGSVGGLPLVPADPDIGYNDPEECFPDKTKLEEPDTNRLARGVAGKHVDEHVALTKRKEQVLKGIFSAATSWDEPDVPYDALYPYNKVWEGPFNPECDECEWGHIEEWDSTPGAERYFRQHKTSQNFLEIHPDGKEVRKIYGPSFEIDLASKHVLIDGDYQVTIHGNKEERIKGDLLQVVEGDNTQVTMGNKVTNTIEDCADTVFGDSYRITAGDVSDVTTGNFTRQAAVDINDAAAGKFKAIGVDEAVIGVGSVGEITIPNEPPEGTVSPGYAGPILKCDDVNEDPIDVDGFIVPEIPASPVVVDASGDFQMKVIPDKIFVQAPDIHMTGHAYIPEIDVPLARITFLETDDLYSNLVSSTEIGAEEISAGTISAGEINVTTLLYGTINSGGSGFGFGGPGAEAEINEEPSIPVISYSGTTPAVKTTSEIEYASPIVPGEIHPECP